MPHDKTASFPGPAPDDLGREGKSLLPQVPLPWAPGSCGEAPQPQGKVHSQMTPNISTHLSPHPGWSHPFLPLGVGKYSWPSVSLGIAVNHQKSQQCYQITSPHPPPPIAEKSNLRKAWREDLGGGRGLVGPSIVPGR